MTKAQFLKEAKALIARRNGWTQGTYKETKQPKTRPNDHAYCLLGAFNAVAVNEGIPQLGTLVEGAKKLLTECIKDKGFTVGRGFSKIVPDIITFNDASRRTKKQVLEVLDCAIAKAGG